LIIIIIIIIIIIDIIIIDNKMGVACRTNGERRNAYRLLVGKPEGRSPLT
jgi:hypothetical protein